MIKKILLLQLTVILGFILPAQICSYPSASAELNIGNVRAGLLNGGDMWWTGNASNPVPRYEFPKVPTGSTQTPIHALFAGGIWLSARDNNNDLKVAAMTYRTTGFDFYTGPIDNITGTTTFNTCNFFDRFWEIYKNEIDIHLANVALGTPVAISSIPSNILDWPAIGNPHIVGYNINQDLAPFVDYNSNGIYDPENGDYPETIGDQTFFWVINDIGGPHEETGGDPLEVEVQFLAHAFESPSSPLYSSTVYEIKVVNKSFGNLSDLRFGLFVDANLGYSIDDNYGCDTLKDAGFVYNGNLVNGAYGQNPPVISYQFLNQELESFAFFINGGNSPINDPEDFNEFNNCLHGLFANGDPYGSIPNVSNIGKFVFPGNPDSNSPYAMINSPTWQNTGGLRTIQSTGTQNFPAWSSFDVSIAVNATTTTNYQPDSFYYQVEEHLDSVLAEYLFLKAGNPTTGISNSSILNNQIAISPNPAQNQVQLSFGDLEVFEVQLINVEGRIVQTENTNFNVLDISGLPAGIYFVKVRTKEGVGVQKMIKN